MLTRVPVAFVLLIFCPKDVWSQQNEANIATGSPKNTPATVHTKRNVIQKSMNQMSSNQGLQIDLQQRLNAWRAANLQAQKNPQGLNVPAGNLQPPNSATTQNNDLQNSISPNVKQAIYALQSSQSNNLQAPNSQNTQTTQVDCNNVKNENKASDSQLQNVANTEATNTPNLQQILQLLQSSLQQQQSQNFQNVQNVPVQPQQLPQQTLNVPPTAESQHLIEQQPRVTTTQDRSVIPKPNTEMNSHVNLHSANIPREVPVEQSQSQHFLLPSSPAQVIDRTQLQNLLQYSPHLTQTPNSVQNGMSHQVSAIHPMQPSIGTHSNPQPYTHQIYPTYPTTFAANQTPMTNMYEAQSGISRIGSSNSHMRTLLPIIYSLLRDSNDCGCCNHRCDCSQMRRNQQQSVRPGLENRSGSKSNDKRNENKHETTSNRKVNTKDAKESDASEKFDKSYEDYYSEEDCYDDESNYID